MPQHVHERRKCVSSIEILESLILLNIPILTDAQEDDAGKEELDCIRQLGGAKSEAAEIQLEKLGGVLDLYRLEVGVYPTTAEGLTALVDRPAAAAPSWNGPYLKNRDALTDPWGRPYQYRAPGDHGDYDIWSLGADGKPGGEGENRDVASW